MGYRGALGALIAGSLFFGSTAAAARPATQPSPWAVLSVASGGASAAALCGAGVVAAAAEQPAHECVLPQVDVPQAAGPATPEAIPTVAPQGTGLGIDPLLLVLAAIAGGVALYLLLHNHHHHANSPA